MIEKVLKINQTKNMQNEQKGTVPVLTLVVIVAIIAFLAFSGTLSFKNHLFGNLYPKPPSNAAAPSPSPLPNIILSIEGKNIGSVFQTNSSATTQINLPTHASQLVVRAKADTCKGYPHMIATIDGNIFINTEVITTDSWSDYLASVNLSPGNHALSIFYDNDYSWIDGTTKKCDRNLIIDQITLR